MARRPPAISSSISTDCIARPATTTSRAIAESAQLLAEEGETPDPAEKGVLPNSFVRTDSGALGMTLDRRARFPRRRRQPVRHALRRARSCARERKAQAKRRRRVTIAMDQHRYELRGGLDDLGVFKSLRAKVARTEYTHTEFEGEQVGTVFENTSTKAGSNWSIKPLRGWNGAIGVQGSQRDFEAIGEEAFVPPSQSRDAGVFWIGDRSFGPVKVELGARHDHNRSRCRRCDRDRPGSRLRHHQPVGRTEVGRQRSRRTCPSGSTARSARPTAEELYSDGLHVATSSVELGSPELDVETANRAEIGLHWHGGPFKASASVYHVRYDDFIYLADTGVRGRRKPGAPVDAGRCPLQRRRSRVRLGLRRQRQRRLEPARVRRHRPRRIDRQRHARCRLHRAQ